MYFPRPPPRSSFASFIRHHPIDATVAPIVRSHLAVRSPPVPWSPLSTHTLSPSCMAAHRPAPSRPRLRARRECPRRRNISTIPHVQSLLGIKRRDHHDQPNTFTSCGMRSCRVHAGCGVGCCEGTGGVGMSRHYGLQSDKLHSDASTVDHPARRISHHHIGTGAMPQRRDCSNHRYHGCHEQRRNFLRGVTAAAGSSVQLPGRELERLLRDTTADELLLRCLFHAGNMYHQHHARGLPAAVPTVAAAPRP